MRVIKLLYNPIIRIIIISPSTTEGVNLMNVRQVHVLEQHWNYVRIKQVIGRAIRQCSHKDLPLNDRNVKIFNYTYLGSSG